jgi:hypothetical protein
VLILVVDDDPSSWQMIGPYYLTGEGYEQARATRWRKRPMGTKRCWFWRSTPRADSARQGDAWHGWLGLRPGVEEAEYRGPILVMRGSEHAATWSEKMDAVSSVPKPISQPLLHTRIRRILGDPELA